MNSKFETNSEPEKPDFLRTLKLTSVVLAGGILCHICNKTYQNKKEYDDHYKQHNTDSIIYTCIICRKHCSSYPSFRGHCYVSHVIKDRFECKHCSKKISTEFALQEHIKAMHSFSCTVKGCKKKFQTQNELTIHKIIHKNEENKPPYQCQTCDKQMTTIDESEQHMDKHCTFIYMCPICNKEFKKNQAVCHLKNHFEDSATENKVDIENDDEMIEDGLSSIDIIGGILCCHCKSTFKNRELLDSHFSLEHSDKKLVYSCILCKKQFEKYALFGGHCYDHVAKTKFECEECRKSFSRLSHLVMHTDVYHPRGAESHPDGTPLQCAHCPSTFFGDRRYKLHLQTKHNKLIIDCPEPGCNSTFHSKKELFLHAKVHKSLNNWCRQCGLQLPTPSACEKHLDVHRKKLYSCPVCNRSYREKNPLLNHLMQHFEAILHVCKTCGKVYNAKRRLVEHVKIHSVVKNYKCQHCSKSFAKTNHLKQHLATHTGIKPYKCTVCSKTFATYPNWHKHLKKMHNLDKNSIKNISRNNNSDDAKKTTNPEPEKVTNIQTTLTENPFDDESDSTMDSDYKETINNAFAADKGSEVYEADMDVTIPTSDCSGESNILPEEIADFATERAEGAELPRAPTRVPSEYGPEFVNTAREPAHSALGKYIDLDDHLPHIDPRLATTISNDVTGHTPAVTNGATDFTRDVTNGVTDYIPDVTAYISDVTDDITDYISHVTDDVTAYISDVAGDVTAFMRSKPVVKREKTVWDPPVITKVYGNFYDEIGDMNSNLLSIIKSDVF